MPVRVFDEHDGLPVPMISRNARYIVGPHTGARVASLNLVRLEPGEANTPHAHRHSEDSVFILVGRGSILDFDVGVSYEVSAGSAVMVPPGLRHAFRGGEPDGLWSVGGPVPPDWEMLRAMGLSEDFTAAVRSDMREGM
jgi:quercetin dioxygenase-like cupin family protein